jgi:hypothetical protein
LPRPDESPPAKIGGPAKLLPLLRRYGPIFLIAATWVFIGSQIDLGWLPNDDGTLAHAADRVRAGQIPHLDFHEPYPGLLSYLNATVLEYLDDRLVALRYPYFVLIGCWMWIGFKMARRVLTSPMSAVLISSIAIASFLMHMSPMPTWYNLILGTGGLYFALRFNDLGNRWFLFAGGLLIGVSTLIKTNGLLMALAMGLALAVRAIRSGQRREVFWGRVFLILGVSSIGLFLAGAPTPERFVLFLVPLIIVVVAEWKPHEAGAESSRPHSVVSDVLVGALGIMVPIAIFVVGFWTAGAADELWRTTMVVPSLYVADLSANVPGLRFGIATLVPGLVIWLLALLPPLGRLSVGLLAVACICVTYALDPTLTILVTYSSLIWLGLVLGIAYVARQHSSGDPVPFATLVVVLGALTFQLVQYPTSNTYYLIHALPLVVLGVVMLIGQAWTRSLRPTLVTFMVIAAIFAVAKVEGRFLAAGQTGVVDQYVALEGPRGGLRVPRSMSYVNDVLDLIRDTEEPGDTTLTGPDSPEIYYLAAIENPTPVFFDFLSDAIEPGTTTSRYLRDLRPQIFVNNRDPLISLPLEQAQIPEGCEALATFGPREVLVGCD